MGHELGSSPPMLPMQAAVYRLTQIALPICGVLDRWTLLSAPKYYPCWHPLASTLSEVPPDVPTAASRF